jgi:NitT/TauT family transport system substrate-binding protein
MYQGASIMSAITKRTWIVGAVAVAVVVLAAVVTVVRRRPPSKVTVRVGNLLVPGQAKLFVAKELGYFAEEGLDVQLVEFTNSADGLAALRAGKLDFGAFGATAPLFHIAKDADIRIVGGIHDEDAGLITTAKNAETIHSVLDLKGKKVAVVRLSSGDAALRGRLLEVGLIPGQDVQIVEIKSPPAVIQAVEAGDADAGMVWEPHIVRAQEAGLKVVARSHDLVPGHPCCRLVSQTQFTVEHADTVKRFLRALLKAEKYGHDNRSGAVDIIAKYIKLDRNLVDASYLNDQPTDPNIENTVRFWNVLRKIGFAEKDKAIASYIDTRAYKQALDELVAENRTEGPYWNKLEDDFAKHDASFIVIAPK